MLADAAVSHGTLTVLLVIVLVLLIAYLIRRF